jgi:hypothetical protein
MASPPSGDGSYNHGSYFSLMPTGSSKFCSSSTVAHPAGSGDCGPGAPPAAPPGAIPTASIEASLPKRPLSDVSRSRGEAAMMEGHGLLRALICTALICTWQRLVLRTHRFSLCFARTFVGAARLPRAARGTSCLLGPPIAALQQGGCYHACAASRQRFCAWPQIVEFSPKSC